MQDTHIPITRRQLSAHHNHQQAALNCPRCDSTNTKFCYYNNYNLSQPRHVCKSCRRYWTLGGLLRNVPFGGASRKSKRAKPTTASASSPSVNGSDPTAQIDLLGSGDCSDVNKTMPFRGGENVGDRTVGDQTQWGFGGDVGGSFNRTVQIDRATEEWQTEGGDYLNQDDNGGGWFDLSSIAVDEAWDHTMALWPNNEHLPLYLP